MTGPPVPGELCRHSTHDAFEQGDTWAESYSLEVQRLYFDRLK